MGVYINFADDADILRQFSAPKTALRGAKILLAWYGQGGYGGCTFVLFKKNSKLYEVNGIHCSCNGLEGQWEPEETSAEVLEKRHIDNYSFYEDSDKCSKELQLIVAMLRRKEKKHS